MSKFFDTNKKYMIKVIKDNLKDLGFKSNEIKIYVALTQLGEATAAQIAKKADLPRTTAISVLNKLSEDNYLTTHKYKGITFYWIESPQVIADTLENKIEIAKELNESLTNLYRSEAHFPFAQVYDSKTSIRKFIEKLLSQLEKGSTIYTIDSPHEGNYQKIFSEKISQSLSQLKNKRNITTHTLIPYGSYKVIDPKKLARQNIIIRELPHSIDYKSSIWIIKDLVVHFSGKPPFVCAIRHELIYSSTKSWFEYLWKTSEEK